MIESVIILGKVALVCGAGFVVATGFEWFSDMEIKPKNKTIQVGEEVKDKREVSDNDDKIDSVRKKVRSQS